MRKNGSYGTIPFGVLMKIEELTAQGVIIKRGNDYD